MLTVEPGMLREPQVVLPRGGPRGKGSQVIPVACFARLLWRIQAVYVRPTGPDARGEAMAKTCADISVRMRRLPRRRSSSHLAARVGADPLETGDTALQRLVMVLLAVGTLPLTILWTVVYLAAGAPLAAAAPAVYSVATPINTALFAWTRNLRLYRFIQLLMTLVLPWLVTMSLGGFKNSSAVIIWAALCPLVSLLVEDLRQTVLWIVGFVLLLIVSASLEPSLKPPALPEAFVTWFFVLNLGSVIAIVFALLYYFVAQRNFFQERSETLLLNILPKEISDALKADQGAIAAHYEFRKRPVRRCRRLHADGRDDGSAAPGQSPQRGVLELR